MKSIKPVLNFAVALLSFSLIACTNSSVKGVQETSPNGSDFTYKQIFDSAKGCESTAWTSSDDGNGRPLVQYECTAQISEDLVKNLKEKSINEVKDFSKRVTDHWQAQLASAEEKKKRIGEIGEESRLNRERILIEQNQQLANAQEKLKGMLARSPEEFQTYKIYTPQQLEEGKERKKFQIQQQNSEIERIQKYVEALSTQGETINPQNQVSGYRSPKSAQDYQSAIDGMLVFKERFFAAVKEAETRELSEIDTHFSSAKDNRIKMRLVFLVKNKSPAELTFAQWIFNDKVESGVNFVYLGAIFSNPKRIQEVIEEHLKGRLGKTFDSLKYDNKFPIICNIENVAGCALKST